MDAQATTNCPIRQQARRSQAADEKSFLDDNLNIDDARELQRARWRRAQVSRRNKMKAQGRKLLRLWVTPGESVLVRQRLWNIRKMSRLRARAREESPSEM